MLVRKQTQHTAWTNLRQLQTVPVLCLSPWMEQCWLPPAQGCTILPLVPSSACSTWPWRLQRLYELVEALQP